MNNVVQIVQDAAKKGRKMRYPKHPFNLRTKPWQLQPFLFAPVLPGETMSNLLMQARAVSDPIKDKLVGWHNEYYFFYVKLRDLDIRDSLLGMFTDPAHTNAPLRLPNDPESWAPTFYQGPGSIPYLRRAYERCVDEFFRNEGETVYQFQIDGVPAANLNYTDTMQSAVLDADVEAAPKMPGEDIENENEIAGFDQAYLVWEHMRAMQMTDLTYEDYLRANGVKGKVIETIVEDHRPELLRYVRDWSYPTNAVDPATGVPTSAVVWSHMERADKDRLFKEPGFILGITVCRPKVYVRSLAQSSTGFLQSAFDWLPGNLRDQAQTSLRKFIATWEGGPYANRPDGDYWVDIRDLFLHGEQFLNYPQFEGDNPLETGLPVAMTEPGNFKHRYANDAEANRLFVNANGMIRQDGIVSLSIKGTVQEMTP